MEAHWSAEGSAYGGSTIEAYHILDDMIAKHTVDGSLLVGTDTDMCSICTAYSVFGWEISVFASKA